MTKKLHKKTIIGVMGSYHATETEQQRAYDIGARIAAEGWVTLTGGEPAGVMEAASTGAKEADGLVVGILGGRNIDEYSSYIDIPIFTRVADSRNLFNIYTSDVIVVCSRLSYGTLIEVAAALKSKTPLIVFADNEDDAAFLRSRESDLLTIVESVDDALEACKKYLHDKN